MGLALGTDSIALPFGSIAAQVALMNGNGANQLVNDTQYPSVAGRVALGILGFASLGLDGYFQPRASGQQPDLFRDNLLGFGGDLRLEKGPFHALLLAQVRQTTHVSSKAPDETALGFSAEASYRLFGVLEPAVRFASLDPSDKVPQARVQELTAALNFHAPHAPARLSLAYAHRMEQDGRSLSNDGLEVAVQVRF